MKKEYHLLLLLITFILFYSSTYCQNRIKVTVTNKQNAALPFASVAYLKNEIGGSTDSAGQLTIKKIIEDTLKISCIGYNAAFLSVNNEINTLSVILEEQPKLLDDVLITNQKKKYESSIWLGYPFAKNDAFLTTQTMDIQEAVFIKNEKKITGIINTLKFKLNYYRNKNFLLRIRLLSIDTSTMLPSNDLLLSDNIFSPKQCLVLK